MCLSFGKIGWYKPRKNLATPCLQSYSSPKQPGFHAPCSPLISSATNKILMHQNRRKWRTWTESNMFKPKNWNIEHHRTIILQPKNAPNCLLLHLKSSGQKHRKIMKTKTWPRRCWAPMERGPRAFRREIPGHRSTLKCWTLVVIFDIFSDLVLYFLGYLICLMLENRTKHLHCRNIKQLQRAAVGNPKHS